MALPLDLSRPSPPDYVLSAIGDPRFAPDQDFEGWIRSRFIDAGGELENPDHQHLQQANIGVLWTNVSNSRKGRQIVAQCELGQPRATQGKWAKARAETQINNWFGGVPDFILTFDAIYASMCSDDEFCALVEHELYHAAQDTDEYGAPKFRKETGLPVFAIRGHDIEEFVGVVRRYGAESAGVTQLIEAAKAGPEIAPVSIARACGTCALKVA